MSDVKSESGQVLRAYPRTMTLSDGRQVRLRLMSPGGDVYRLHAFASSLPKDDLQFLRVDITRLMVVMLWAQNIKAGRTVTVLAEVDGEVVGYASMHNDQVSWQRHLGELRIQVGQAYRGCGLGGVLGKEIFAIASDLGIEKIVAQMTVDHRQAIALVERHGFKHEAVLHDFVIGRDGRKNDLVVMTCDVARLEAGAH
jgi:RimJ/RimL family protein N-acetyltransferase